VTVDVAHPLDLLTFFTIVSLINAKGVNPEDTRAKLVSKVK
jgi:hypothetical protein